MISSKISWLILTVTFTYITVIDSAVKFIPENEEIFEKCEKFPDSNGIHDIIDVSELTLSYEEDSVHVEGNVTFIWDVEPTDHVELRADIYKYLRNTWTPTPFSLIYKNFCENVLTPDNYVYKAWSKYIYDDDIKCPTNGVHFRHHPINAKLEFPENVRISGQHKLTIQFMSFNENGDKKNIYCIDVPIDVVPN